MTSPTLPIGTRVRVAAPSFISTARGYYDARGTVTRCPFDFEHCGMIAVTVDDDLPEIAGVHFSPEELEVIR